MRDWVERAKPILRRDFEALTRAGTGVMLLLIAPVALILALDTDQAERPARVLVAGSAADPRVTSRLLNVMRESSQLVVSQLPDATTDPLATLKQRRMDILLNYEGVPPAVSMYTLDTEPRRLAHLERLGAGFARAEAVIAQRLATSGPRTPLFPQVKWARPMLYEDLFMMGALPIQPLAEYFPQAADPRVARLPMLILVMLSVLPFALAVALASAEAIESAAKWSDTAFRAAASAIVPAAASVFELLIILLLAEWVLDVHIKAGVIRMALLVFAAGLGYALAGLAVVAISRSRAELAGWCTLAVVMITLLSASPPTQRQPWLEGIAQVLPATHLESVLTNWLFGAPYDANAAWAGGRLVLLAAALWCSAIILVRSRAARVNREATSVPTGEILAG